MRLRYDIVLFMNLKSLESYLKTGLMIGIFMVPFITFVVINDMFFPFITGKNFVFRVLVELMFGGWIVLAYLNEAYRPKITWVLVSVVLFIGVLGIADVSGVNVSKSIWSNYERMEGYVTMLHFLAYFLVLISVMRTKKQWSWLLHTMVGASVIMIFIGFSQLSNPEIARRLDTTLGNASYLAAYVLFHIFIAMYLLNWKKQWAPWVYGPIIMLQLVILYYTATRGAILGVIGGLLLASLLIALFEKKNELLKKSAIGVIGTIVICVSLFVAFRDSEFIREQKVLKRFAAISLEEATTKSRFLIWNMAYQGFKERPILGWGQGNFPYIFSKYYDAEMYAQEPWFDRAHNVFFDWLTAAGIFGLLSYLSIFAASIYQLWKRKEDDFTIVGKSILTGLLAAYFFHNIFVFDNLISYILFFTVIAYIHFRSTHGSFSSRCLDRVSGMFKHIYSGDETKEKNMVIPALALVITPMVIYAVNYAPYMQNKTLIKALRQYPEGYQTNLDLYKKALSYDSFGNGETRERLLFQAITVSNQQVGPDIKTDYGDLAIAETKKQIASAPGDAKYPLFASSLYRSFGHMDKAKEMIEQAREISPEKQIILFNLGTFLLDSGQFEEAFDVYRQAYESAPSYDGAAKRYGLAALYAGREDITKEVLAAANYDTYPIPDPSYINYFAKQGRFDTVRDLLLQAIENEPNQPQHRFQLVGAYIELDEKDKALEALEEISRIFPNLKENADYYISEINNGNI